MIAGRGGLAHAVPPWVRAHLPFVLLLVVLLPALWPHDGVGDTFRYWYAGHIVATGASPYDQNVWGAAGGLYGDLAENVSSSCSPTPYAAECLWAYPPITAIAFAPFALLPVRQGLDAVAAFVVLVAIVGVVLVGWWARARSSWTLAIALCAAVVSHPFVFDVHAGHFEGLGLIAIVSLGYGLRSHSTAPIVLGMVLISLKPHLYVGLALAVFVLLVLRRDWRTIGAIVFIAAAANVLALLRYPEAVSAILSRSSTISGLGWASPWWFALNIAPNVPVVGLLVVYGTAIPALFVAMRYAPDDRRIDVAIAGAGAVSLMMSPYVQPYDLLILFPAFALSATIVEQGSRNVRVAVLAATATAFGLGTWLAVAANARVGGSPGITPVVALVALAVAIWSTRPRQSVSTAAS